jgi:hypothetical protein
MSAIKMLDPEPHGLVRRVILDVVRLLYGRRSGRAEWLLHGGRQTIATDQG